MDLSRYVFELLRADEELALHRGRTRTPAAPGGRPILLLRAVSNIPHCNDQKARARVFTCARAAFRMDSRPVVLTEHQGRTALVLEDPVANRWTDWWGHRWSSDSPCAWPSVLRPACASCTRRRSSTRTSSRPTPGRHCDWQGVADGFGIASRLRRNGRRPRRRRSSRARCRTWPGANRTHEPVDRFAERPLRGRRHALRDADGAVSVHRSDPMEWVHCHIARRPQPTRREAEGGSRSGFGDRAQLLAKTPEDRYRTAAGLECDLRRCLAHAAPWPDRRFPARRRRPPDRLLIPEKLYGRSREVETLLAAFNRMVTSGSRSWCWFPGTRASAVVGGQRAAQGARTSTGPLRLGKVRPAQARHPVRHARPGFSEADPVDSEQERSGACRWRDALSGALEPNGQLMVNLVPELELIMGEQPPVPELPPQDAQRRFQFVLRRFLGIFAGRSTRWRSSWTTCSGWTRRPSTCSKI